MPRLNAAFVFSLATLCAPAFGQNANPAVPGTLNYVEGQVSIDGQALTQRAVGQASVQTGQELSTGTGKAEILLTPGVFLRLDDHSAVKMVSPSLTNTVVALDSGRASIEVDELHKQNRIVVDEKNGQSLLVKAGLYQFDANTNTMRVFDGKAAVFEGRNNDAQLTGKSIDVKGGHELALTGEGVKPGHFDKDQAKGDELYQWSSLRSEYLGEANVNLAAQYGEGAGMNSGWFWDAGLYGYTWLPGGGPFFSPFGFGFYSPAYLYGGGALYGYRGYGGGYGYRGGYAGGLVRAHAGPGYAGHGQALSGGYRGGSSVGGGGFHGGTAGGGMSGGGFHGGGGGGRR